MDKELNYEQDMSIVHDDLDIEWLEQGNLALKYVRHAAYMRQQAKLAEEKVKTVRSDLINQANKDPEGTTGKTKPNAQDIEAFYRNHNQYKEAKENMIEAQYEADYAEMAKNEICWTRRKSLENLVVLHGQMYFAGPSVPRDISKEWKNKQKQKKADVKVGDKLKRTKK